MPSSAASVETLPSQARKQRRTISENVDTTCPAYRVVQKAGGLARFCELFDFPTSTVFGWMVHRNGRGRSGLIPSRTRWSEELGKDISYQSFIVRRGRTLDPPIEFTAEDFCEAEEG